MRTSDSPFDVLNKTRRLSRSSQFVRSGGGVAGPNSTITSLTIMGATPLLDATGDWGDATARTGVNGAGWIGRVIMPRDVTDPLFDPTKISITVSDAGFSAANVAANYTRTIRGGKILRRQYPAQASPQSQRCDIDGTRNTGSGAYFMVYFTLIGDNAEFATIYSTSTIVSASASAGYYGTAAAGSIATRTNNSTRAVPSPITAWVTRQHDLITGSFDVEATVFHKHGQFGQMVAGVRFWAEDSQGTPNVTPNVDTSTPVLSSVMTQGYKPEVYKATLSPTNLTQADLCYCFMIVYPWIGPAWSLKVNRADAGATTLTTLAPMVPLRVLNDKAGTWTGAHAAVKTGAAGGTVQATRALAETTPFPTIADATTALPAWNNTNKGHNTHDGSTVWLMDNAGVDIEYSTGGINASLATSGACWTRIRPSPSNTAVASVKIDSGGQNMPKFLSWESNIRQVTTSSFYGNVANTQVAYQNCTLTWVSIGFAQCIDYEQLPILHNVSVSGQFFPAGYNVGTVMNTAAQTGNSRSTQMPCAIGSRFYNSAMAEDVNTLDGRVYANNQFLGLTATAVSNKVGHGVTVPVVKGVALVQNVFESFANASSVLVYISGDGSVQPVDNILNIYNTAIGDRTNECYADVAGAVGVIKYVTSRFNLNQEVNTKSDIFSTNYTSGNWAFVNGVDRWEVNIRSTGGSDSVTPPAVGAWVGEYWGNSQYSVGAANVTFTDNKSASGTNVGNGTYTLTGGSNAAYNVVPSTKAALKFDMAGAARLNGGTGAAGAYERP